MQGIFVSYRRQDSQSAAGRLCDHLRDHLAGVPIFRDVETIEPGVDFVEAIDRALRACSVVIAVIGPRWIDATDAQGRRRLDDPNDYTRLEIATALKRDGVRVIPVLADGAQMPGTDELTNDLRSLARRNATELTDKRWDFDVTTLVATLRKVLGLADDPPPTPPPGPDGKRKWYIGAGIGLLAMVAIVAEENGGGEPPLPSPVIHDTPAVVAPAPVAPVTPAVTASAGNFTGLWRDAEGGMHEIAQRGNQLMFRGNTPDGYVEGVATVSGRQGQGSYTLDGYPLRSSFTMSADGTRIDVQVLDPASGEREVTVLYRVR